MAADVEPSNIRSRSVAATTAVQREMTMHRDPQKLDQLMAAVVEYWKPKS